MFKTSVRGKIAVVYDWIDKWGGVERVLLELKRICPQADFYTSYYDSKEAVWAKDLQVKTSFIQSLPDFIKKSRVLSTPFYPYAFESFDFSPPAGGYDLLISVTSSFAKSVITKPGTVHICYLLTPTRFLWLYPDLYFKNNLAKFFLQGYIDNLKKWDLVASKRPDKIIAISETVAKRCRDYYQRESEVIYPPFDLEYWKKIKSGVKKNSDNKKYYLIVSRLEPYKKVDLVVDVFNKLVDKDLVIVGKGSEKKKLIGKANKNIKFIEDVSDQELAFYYSNAEALIMPQEEDFGYVSLEGQFLGCPVIAYGKGGAGETVTDGETGIFFARQDRRSIKDAIERFEKISYNLKIKVKALGETQALKFSKENFENRFIKVVNNSIKPTL
jgi:glycosyltransferase involved in cell wall biosynthesis